MCISAYMGIRVYVYRSVFFSAITFSRLRTKRVGMVANPARRERSRKKVNSRFLPSPFAPEDLASRERLSVARPAVPRSPPYAQNWVRT